MEYSANAGQTYLPFQENINVGLAAWEPLARPEPPLPPLRLREDFAARGYVIQSQAQHVLPGVTPEMLDWFWANMEKGYYLWAPGSHKRFNWVREPWRYGFVRSAHKISESVGPGMAVFGGDGVQIDRIPLTEYPFTQALEHGIVEGVFNDPGELVDSTIHLWQACEGGCVHMTASVANTRCSEPPAFVKQQLAEGQTIVAPSATDHCEYEAAMWPRFLPRLYELWKEHPDPAQSVRCDLRIRQTAEGGFAYAAENGPVAL